MNIFVDVRHKLIRDNLVATLERCHRVTGEAEADIAVKDLWGYTLPYPAPPRPPTLALIYDGSSVAVEVLRTGYRGYLGERDGIEQLERALKALVRGEYWAERHVLATLLDPLNLPLLTRREAQVYALVRKGYSNKDVADELGLSVNTVKVFVSKLLLKMECGTRRDLMLEDPLRRS